MGNCIKSIGTLSEVPQWPGRSRALVIQTPVSLLGPAPDGLSKSYIASAWGYAKHAL